MALAEKKGCTVFLSAGEASGDLHGSRLVRAIKARNPEIRVTCLGGSLLHQAGAELLVDNRGLAVVGLFEVLHHTRAIYGAWRKIRAHMLQERPALVVLIDFPDFNFLLGRMAKRLGLKVFYYISPQVWAWRSGRVRSLEQFVDEMAVILPFEPEFYEHRGMKVHFVGHPLLDVLADAPSREDACRRHRNGSSSPVVGLLPGSRRSEIRSLLPLMLEAADLMHRQHPSISFLLPVAPTLDSRSITEEAAHWNLPLRIVSGDTYGVIRACDLVLAASGTVTLETAILGTPMIITYRVSGLSYHTGRSLIRVKYVGMPNVIAGRRIVPELLQEDARPDRLAAEALDLLMDTDRLERQRRSLSLIADSLGQPGVADRVARLAMDMMQ